MTTDISKRESIKYLRNEAIRAHLDGQGAKARHLAAIALRSQAKRSDMPDADFNDFSWAFCLIINWMLEDFDYSFVLDGAWEAFGKKQGNGKGPIAKNANDHGCTIIRFLLDVLRPDSTKWENDIKNLRGIPAEFFQREIDQHEKETISLLLSLVIEFMYYISTELDLHDSIQPQWNSLSKNWEGILEKSTNLSYIYNKLKETRERLEKQDFYIFNRKLWGSTKEKNSLEVFWKAFYEINNPKMEESLSSLVKLVKDDEDKFYAVQTMLNISRYRINNLFEDQSFGLYRIQRLYMENPKWLFVRLRSLRFYEKLREAFFRAERKKPIGSESSYLWRLALLAQIFSLRNWDIQGYLNALSMQSKTSIFWGLFPADFGGEAIDRCDALFLAKGIFTSIKGLIIQQSGSPDFEDVRRSINILEILPDSKNQIKSLINKIIETSRPIEALGTLKVLGEFSDSLPKDCIGDVLKFAVENWGLDNTRFDMKSLNWWEDIFKWFDLDLKDWEIIEPILSQMFENPAFWQSSDSMMKEALLKAPSKYSKKWANSIVKKVVNNRDLQKGITIIFNAALEKNELINSAIILLDKLKSVSTKKHEIEYDKKLLLEDSKFSKSFSDASSAYRNELINEFIDSANSIINRKDKPHRSFEMPSEYKQYLRISWKNLKPAEWEKIDKISKEALLSLYVMEKDFLTLMTIWSKVASEQRRSIVNKSAKWFIEKGVYIRPIKELEIPYQAFSNFTFGKGIKDISGHVKANAISILLRNVSSPFAKKILLYIQDDLINTETLNLTLYWKGLLLILFAGDKKLYNLAMNIIKSIYARVSFDEEFLTEVIDGSYQTLNYFLKKHYKEQIDSFKERDISSVLEILDGIVEKLIISPIPDGRRASALLIDLLLKNGLKSAKREEWRKKLKNDPRARVYTIFR